MDKKKWLYPAKKEVNKNLNQYESHRLANQQVGKGFAVETYIIQHNDMMFVKLFFIQHVEYGEGFKVTQFIDESTYQMVKSQLDKIQGLDIKE